MAKIVENEKGFRVIEVSRTELVEKLGYQGAVGICDFCNRSSSVGYLICVLNSWYCPDCYKRYISNAKRYAEDVDYEFAVFNRYVKLFGINQ